MTPSLERTAKLLEDAEALEALRLFAEYQSRGDSTVGRLLTRAAGVLRDEAARLRALPEGKATVWALAGPDGKPWNGSSNNSRVSVERSAEEWNEYPMTKRGGPYRVVGLAVVEDHTPTGERK